MYYLMNKNEKIAKTAFEGGAAWATSEHNIPGVWHGWFICQVLDQTSLCSGTGRIYLRWYLLPGAWTADR